MELIERLATFEIESEDLVFRDDEALLNHLYSLEKVEVSRIGYSRDGREMFGLRFGEGSRAVSVIAGCHADEPVGPMTAQILPRLLRRHFPEVLEQFQVRLVPQMNPDGAAANFRWFKDPPRLDDYLNHAVREQPGDDIEFGFGEGRTTRPECRAAQEFLKRQAPYTAHYSLHGMAFAEGAWCLICKEWRDRAEPYMDAFTSLCQRLAFPQHDVDRGGEKGFFRIREGFSTTPRSDAMKSFFLAQNDMSMARKFLPSSMEWIQSLGGDPLCVVSELPIFISDVASPDRTKPINPELQADIHALRGRGDVKSAEVEPIIETYRLSPVPLETQVRLQVAMVVLSLSTSLQPN